MKYKGSTATNIVYEIQGQYCHEHSGRSITALLQLIRENYNTKHVLIRLLEKWKLYLGNKYFVGAVMTDLLKAFDCIPHDSLIAKLEAYVYFYLKNRKQCVKINYT